MRCSATPDPIVGGFLKLNGDVKQKLDYAEKPLPRPRRNGAARQAQSFALSRLVKAGEGGSWDNPDFLRAFIDFLEATRAVLLAEPDEHRDFLPPFIREDPEGAIAAEIADTAAKITALEREREQAEQAVVRDRLNGMTTADFGRLPAIEREDWLSRLGLDVPPERPSARDALGRLTVELHD